MLVNSITGSQFPEKIQKEILEKKLQRRDLPQQQLFQDQNIEKVLKIPRLIEPGQQKHTTN